MLISEVLEKAASSYSKWGWVAVFVPTTMERALKRLQREIDTDDLADDGVEKEPHVTIAYGLDDNVDVNRLKLTFALSTPVTFRVEDVSAFTDNPKYDVLKYRVKSGELSYLRRRVREDFGIPGTTYRYNPHVTIAYVKKGKAGKYLKKFKQLVNRSYTTTNAVYDPKGFGKRYRIMIGRGQFAYMHKEAAMKKAALPEGSSLFDRARHEANSLLWTKPHRPILGGIIKRLSDGYGQRRAAELRGLLDGLAKELSVLDPASPKYKEVSKLYKDLHAGIGYNLRLIRDYSSEMVDAGLVDWDTRKYGVGDTLKTPYFDDWLESYKVPNVPQAAPVAAPTPAKEVPMPKAAPKPAPKVTNPVKEVAEQVTPPKKLNGSWLKELVSNKKVLGGLGVLGLVGAGGTYLHNKHKNEKAAEAEEVDMAHRWLKGFNDVCVRKGYDPLVLMGLNNDRTAVN